LIDKRLPGGSEEREVVIRKTNGGPFDRRGEAFLYLAAKGWVGIDADSFSPEIRHGSFCWPTATSSLDISVIGCQIYTEISIQK
jgi:hypothetical protein